MVTFGDAMRKCVAYVGLTIWGSAAVFAVFQMIVILLSSCITTERATEIEARERMKVEVDTAWSIGSLKDLRWATGCEAIDTTYWVRRVKVTRYDLTHVTPDGESGMVSEVVEIEEEHRGGMALNIEESVTGRDSAWNGGSVREKGEGEYVYHEEGHTVRKTPFWLNWRFWLGTVIVLGTSAVVVWWYIKW